MPSSRSGGPLPFLDHLAADSARFRTVLATAPAGARVPSCPDWDADDLLWHLGEVQWFWGEIAERGLTDPADLDAMNATREERPADRAGLLDFFDRSSERLHRMLGEPAAGDAAVDVGRRQDGRLHPPTSGPRGDGAPHRRRASPSVSAPRSTVGSRPTASTRPCGSCAVTSPSRT